MSRLRLVAIVLLVAGAGLFAIGTSIEKGRHQDQPATNSEVSGTHDEGAEGAVTEKAAEAKILGIDRESTGLVVLAAIASLALAALLWQRPTRTVWVVAGLGALAFAVFDVAEVVHQLDGSEPGLAALAALVAVAHAGATGIAARQLRPNAST